MKSIFSYFQICIIFIWKCVHICFWKHRLMKCSIKYYYIFFIRKKFLHNFYSHYICRIMQRGECWHFFKIFYNFIIYNYRIVIIFSTMNNSMSYRIYFRNTWYYSVFFILQCFKNQVYCNRMIFHRSFLLVNFCSLY